MVKLIEFLLLATLTYSGAVFITYNASEIIAERMVK